MRPADQPAQLGHVADGGERVDPAGEAELGGVHVADPGQAGLVEQGFVDGAIRIGAAGASAPRARPSRARAGRDRDDRPRRPRGGGGAARRSRARSRPPAGRRWTARRGPRARAGATSARAGRCARTLPSSGGCAASRPRAPRSGSAGACPARGSGAPCRRRGRRWPAGAPGSRCEVRICPASARSRDRAARQTVSPSGTEPQPLRGGDEAGVLQGLAQRCGARAEQLCPVGLLDRQPAERAAADGGRQRLDRRAQQLGVVGPGEQGAPAALDVEGELAVDEDDQGAGLASRPVALRSSSSPVGQGRAAP